MKGFHVRRGVHLIIVSLFLAVAACGGDTGTSGDDDNTNTNTTPPPPPPPPPAPPPPPPPPVMTMSVAVENNFFLPESIQVSPGAMVTWTWGGGNPHNVTFASSAVSPPSPTQTTGTFQVTMPTAAGEHAYQCTIHPTQMNGMVTVQ